MDPYENSYTRGCIVIYSMKNWIRFGDALKEKRNKLVNSSISVLKAHFLVLFTFALCGSDVRRQIKSRNRSPLPRRRRGRLISSVWET